MKALSLSQINSIAPYVVKASNAKGFFEFFTKYDVHFSVGFTRDDSLIQTGAAYHLIVVNVDHHRSPNDAKVKDTVLAIVEEFFDKNNVALLYICETGDGRQKLRYRLFERWFSTYCKRANYTSISSSIVDDEGVVNYATIILRNDNPSLASVITEFAETITLLSNKPSDNIKSI